jgi:TolB-like protein/class 3 adenylate cyclase
MEPHHDERRLTTILAADVVGYSRLMAVDEAGTLAQLKAHRKELIEPKTAEYHGRVVKLTGDGTLMEFGSVVDAVLFAVDVQRAMVKRNADVPEDRRVTYRVGINIGDILVDGDDIYGDGVNVAARLEGLAEPGGICVSRTVLNHVRNKVELDFEDLGEQAVKNIPEPVRVYRVLLEGEAPAVVRPAGKRRLALWPLVATTSLVLLIVAGGALWWLKPWAPDVEPALIERMAFPLPDKPSIAVLPFDNLSDHPAQDYFSDGITEDIITDLSKISGLFVIARNSSFAYKGKSLEVTQIARALGVKYVLEGSVRRADDQVRINAQLIDASTGGHLWAERYDGILSDIFALQDKVTGQIVTALALKLTTGERQELAQRGTDDAEAYDAFLRAKRLLNERGWMERPDNDKARAWLEKAIELDPSYAAAYASLGLTYWLEVRYPSWWGGPHEVKRAFDLAQKAIQLGGPAQAYRLLAQMHLFVSWDDERDHHKAVAAARTAVSLNPNDADSLADLAEVLVFFGEPGEALAVIERAKRRNPNFPGWYHRVAGYGYLLTGQYEQAVEEFTPLFEKEGTISLSSSSWLLAASLAHAGRIEEAKAVLAPYLRRHPATTVKSLAPLFKWFKRREDLDIVLDGLRKAELPE